MPAGQEAEAIVQPRANLIHREHLDARRRELERQRNAVQAATDLQHRRNVPGGECEVRLRAAGSVYEQTHRSRGPGRGEIRTIRLWKLEWPKIEDAFPFD